MHILGILAFGLALIVAIEVIRRTLVENGSRILEALAGDRAVWIEEGLVDASNVLIFEARASRADRLEHQHAAAA